MIKTFTADYIPIQLYDYLHNYCDVFYNYNHNITKHFKNLKKTFLDYSTTVSALYTILSCTEFQRYILNDCFFT